MGRNTELSKRELKVLRLRFGIDVPQKTETLAKETYKNIATEIDLSYERIRQIEAKAFRKLGFPYPEWKAENRNKIKRLIMRLTKEEELKIPPLRLDVLEGENELWNMLMCEPPSDSDAYAQFLEKATVLYRKYVRFVDEETLKGRGSYTCMEDMQVGRIKR